MKYVDQQKKKVVFCFILASILCGMLSAAIQPKVALSELDQKLFKIISSKQ